MRLDGLCLRCLPLLGSRPFERGVYADRASNDGHLVLSESTGLVSTDN